MRKFGNFDMRLTNLAAGINLLQTMSDDLGTQVSASGCTRVLNVPLVMFKVYIYSLWQSAKAASM